MVEPAGAGSAALTVYFGLFLVFLYLPSLLLILFSFNDELLPQFPIKGFTFALVPGGVEHAGAARRVQELADRRGRACAMLAPPVALLAAYPIARRASAAAASSPR